MRTIRAIKYTHIYGLIDPRTNQLRYIGKADSPHIRFKQHLKHRGRSHKHCWLRSLKRLKLIPELIILERVRDSQWQESESWWIDYFKSLGANLTNMIDGGYGFSLTAEIKSKMSVSKKRLWESEEFRKKMKIVHDSPQYRKELSERVKVQAQNKETREKQAAAKRGEKNHNFGKSLTEETKRKISAIRKEQMKASSWRSQYDF